MKKNVLITVSEGSVARNILRSFVLEHILKSPGVVIGIVAPADKFELYEREFGSSRVMVFPYRRTETTSFERALLWFSRNGILTRTVLTDQATRLLRDKSRSRFFVKRAVTYGVGWSYIFHYFVRRLAAFRESSREVAEILDKFRPQVVFATDVQDELDLDMMTGARERGIKIVGMVRSWDNLTSGGLVQIVPDILLVWDSYLFEKAVSVQHISRKIVKIVGVPHYDWYTRKDILLTRDQFLLKLGVDPHKKFILFAGIGNFLAPHESEVVEILSEAVVKNEISPAADIVFRPHPNFLIERDKIKSLPGITFDDGVASYTADTKSSWEMDRERIGHLVNSLYHADLVITTASTITMDAVSFGKPVICIAFDGKSGESYWNSVLRYYRNYTHYIDMTKTRGFRMAFNKDELVFYINKYLENPQLDEEGRKRILEEFIWKLDGKSAERVAAEVLASAS